MKPLNLRTRLLIGFALCIGMGLALSAFTVSRLKDVSGYVVELQSRWLPAMEHVANVRKRLGESTVGRAAAQPERVRNATVEQNDLAIVFIAKSRYSTRT